MSPVCRECKKEFPNKVKKDGKVWVINHRKHCPECLPLGSKTRKPYRTKNYGKSTKMCLI